jgi:WD40-like Beta Propeller Repeat
MSLIKRYMEQEHKKGVLDAAHKKTVEIYGFILLTSLLFISCSAKNPPVNMMNDFGNPRKVTILGYSGDAMEPFISRDDNILFFNNLNSETLPGGVKNDTNLHYAIRKDDITFEYKGEVSGADTDAISNNNELEGVASLDKNNKFYFIRTIDYLDKSSPDYLLSIFQADYMDGTLSNIQGVPNLKNDRPAGQPPVLGELNFDGEIHCDGDVLYFVEGLFSGKPFPDSADIGVASNIHGIFRVNADSADEMAMINTKALEYAPSISTDRLELYFTRATVKVIGIDFGVYVASRSSVSDAWSNVRRIGAITGEFTEAPSISSDGKRLYYHQKISKEYSIYVVERD